MAGSYQAFPNRMLAQGAADTQQRILERHAAAGSPGPIPAPPPRRA